MGKSEALVGDFYMLDWTREVDTHEAYIEALNFVIKFYKNNWDFRLDVAKSTAKVLGKDNKSFDESKSGRITVSLNRLLYQACQVNSLRCVGGRHDEHLVDWLINALSISGNTDISSI